MPADTLRWNVRRQSDHIVGDGGGAVDVPVEYLGLVSGNVARANGLGVGAEIYCVNVEVRLSVGDILVEKLSLGAGIVWAVVGVAVVGGGAVVHHANVIHTTAEPARHGRVGVGEFWSRSRTLIYDALLQPICV